MISPAFLIAVAKGDRRARKRNRSPEITPTAPGIFPAFPPPILPASCGSVSDSGFLPPPLPRRSPPPDTRVPPRSPGGRNRHPFCPPDGGYPHSVREPAPRNFCPVPPPARRRFPARREDCGNRHRSSLHRRRSLQSAFPVSHRSLLSH